ncbi:hypothetical protein HAX54_016319 [Datura stramonium]|uniref:Uncharacterized protein n=1 Tax=Datura stramonium TaxID=4076 RepID=A0ABS8UKB8_DATST|nr:hypothetical protein [Datura stramonium]
MASRELVGTVDDFAFSFPFVDEEVGALPLPGFLDEAIFHKHNKQEELATDELEAPVETPTNRRRLSADYRGTASDKKRTGIENIPPVTDRRITGLDPQTVNVTQSQGSGLKPILA